MTEERPLFDIIAEVYDFLRHYCVVKSQYDFSRNVLKRSSGYYGYLKSSGAESDVEVVLCAFFMLECQLETWKILSDNHRLNLDLKMNYRDLMFENQHLNNMINRNLFAQYGP